MNTALSLIFASGQKEVSQEQLKQDSERILNDVVHELDAKWGHDDWCTAVGKGTILNPPCVMLQIEHDISKADEIAQCFYRLAALRGYETPFTPHPVPGATETPEGGKVPDVQRAVERLALLTAMARADGEIKGEEKAILRELCGKLGLSRDQVADAISRGANAIEIDRLPTTDADRRCLLRDLVRIAAADGVVDASELMLAKKIARLLGIPANEVHECIAGIRSDGSSSPCVKIDKRAVLKAANSAGEAPRPVSDLLSKLTVLYNNHHTFFFSASACSEARSVGNTIESLHGRDGMDQAIAEIERACGVFPAGHELEAAWGLRDPEDIINRGLSLWVKKMGVRMDINDAVFLLCQLYEKHGTFLQALREATLAVGESLESSCGFDGMVRACETVRAKLGGVAHRELEAAWDGVGDWRG